jgi:hypothetical protein
MTPTILPPYSRPDAVLNFRRPSAWPQENCRFGCSYRACPRGALRFLWATMRRENMQPIMRFTSPRSLTRSDTTYQTRPKANLTGLTSAAAHGVAAPSLGPLPDANLSPPPALPYPPVRVRGASAHSPPPWSSGPRKRYQSFLPFDTTGTPNFLFVLCGMSSLCGHRCLRVAYLFMTIIGLSLSYYKTTW